MVELKEKDMEELIEHGQITIHPPTPKVIVCTNYNLVKDRTSLGGLKIYQRGSGDPAQDHDIIGITIDGFSVGEIPPDTKIDKFIDDGGMILLGDSGLHST